MCSWSLRYLKCLMVSAPLEYVTACFIFVLISARICKAAYASWEVGLGGGVCEVMPSGNMIVNTLAPESLSSGNQRQ